jgi:hypothetical protein
LALNGISKCADGTFKIFWADLGDNSDVHAKRRGTNREVVADLDALKVSIPGLSAEQLDQIERAHVGQFLTDTVGNLGGEDVDLVAGTSTCLRVRVEPFGCNKSADLTSPTDGCAGVAVLMAMPEGFRVKVGVDGMGIIFDNLCDTYASNNAGRGQLAAGKDQCEDNSKKGAPPNSGAQIGSLLLCPLSQLENVVNDRDLRHEVLNRYGLDGVSLKKVKLPNAQARGSSRDQPPSKRNPTIEELLAYPPDTYFAITVIMGTRRTHCITLLNNANGTHTFVDPGRREFYEATPGSFKQLGFDGVSDTRQVVWRAFEPKLARAKNKRKRKCQSKAMHKRPSSGQDFSSSSSSSSSGISSAAAHCSSLPVHGSV